MVLTTEIKSKQNVLKALLEIYVLLYVMCKKVKWVFLNMEILNMIVLHIISSVDKSAKYDIKVPTNLKLLN